jgi:hypothetical protein
MQEFASKLPKLSLIDCAGAVSPSARRSAAWSPQDLQSDSFRCGCQAERR